MNWHVSMNVPIAVVNLYHTSRNAYHYAVRRVKTNWKLLRKSYFLNAMLQGDRQFMTETKKIKQHKKNTPSSDDGHYTPLNIANHFAEKYDVLFNTDAVSDIGQLHRATILVVLIIFGENGNKLI